MLSIMLLPIQLILHPSFPSFSATCQASSSKALSCPPPVPAMELDDPSSTVTASGAGWWHIQKW